MDYLGTVRAGPYGAGHYRGIPVVGVALENEVAGQGVEGDALSDRHRRIARGWQKCYSRSTLRDLNRLAHLLACHISAFEQGALEYVVEDNSVDGRMRASDLVGKELANFRYRPTLLRRVVRTMARRNPIAVYYFIKYRRRFSFLRPVKRFLFTVGGLIYQLALESSYWLRLTRRSKVVEQQSVLIKHTLVRQGTPDRKIGSYHGR